MGRREEGGRAQLAERGNEIFFSYNWLAVMGSKEYINRRVC